MSNFGAKLAELLERKQMSAADLSRQTKISDAQISKWTNAKQSFVSTADLAALCDTISTDAREQAELIRARLLDEFQDCPGSELIDVRILSGAEGRALRLDQPPYRVPLPPHLQRAFDIVIPESVTDPDVRDLILGMAGILSRPHCGEDDATNSGSPAHQAAADVVAGAVSDVQSGGEASKSPAPARPTKYPTPRRSKK
jgi:transcriptional regulator with XRE-family HTH domain